jgi:hypothetical protein
VRSIYCFFSIQQYEEKESRGTSSERKLELSKFFGSSNGISWIDSGDYGLRDKDLQDESHRHGYLVTVYFILSFLYIIINFDAYH